MVYTSCSKRLILEYVISQKNDLHPSNFWKSADVVWSFALTDAIFWSAILSDIKLSSMPILLRRVGESRGWTVSCKRFERK